MKLSERVRVNRTGPEPYAPLIVLVWWWLVLDVVHVRPYETGDSQPRYILTEPWDAWATYRGRFSCRVLRRHNLTCRGRRDHPTSWRSG